MSFIIFRVLFIVILFFSRVSFAQMEGDDKDVGIVLFGVVVVGLLVYRHNINRPLENTTSPRIPYWQRPLPVAYVEPPAQTCADRLPSKYNIQHTNGLHNDDNGSLESCISFIPLSISQNELQIYLHVLKYPLIIEKRYALSEGIEVPNDDQTVVIIGCLFIVLILILCASQQYNFHILNEKNPVVDIARQSNGDMPLEFVSAFLNLNTADLREMHLLLDDFSNWCHGRR